MVRALSLDGGELAEIDQLIKRLEDPDGGANIVPPEFLALWASFAPLLATKGARQ